MGDRPASLSVAINTNAVVDTISPLLIGTKNPLHENIETQEAYSDYTQTTALTFPETPKMLSAL
ncbi:hypothetical protein K0M31_002463 [Melipona bicolor]|uniref:Uncharacterized protein n=1 Tax=Melipona bicolor TaxID=60889 RepID=A0AA40KZ65_9HYME|nr:hypothetical protein K0M31_002463 [Melipona bicolor]